jgi:hypothetical protein
MYRAHPDRQLRTKFDERPYQGADPRLATFLFVGLDANYAEDIASQPVLRDVLEYHADGVGFWQRHGVHHPFLLPSYRGDGRLYHLNFARIGFSSAHAAQVSFVELLHLPTVGRSTLEASDLDANHLRWLDSLMRSGQGRRVFLSAKVQQLMRSSGAFPWLGAAPVASGPLPILYRREGHTVYRHLHFSNYGKFRRQMDEEALAIAGMRT